MRISNREQEKKRSKSFEFFAKFICLVELNKYSTSFNLDKERYVCHFHSDPTSLDME